MNFDQIHLSEEELNTLQRLSEGRLWRREIDSSLYHRLKSFGFIKVSFLPDTEDFILITDQGKYFLIFDEERNRQQQKVFASRIVSMIISGIKALLSI